MIHTDMPDYPQVLPEIRRVLLPGGRFECRHRQVTPLARRRGDDADPVVASASMSNAAPVDAHGYIEHLAFVRVRERIRSERKDRVDARIPVFESSSHVIFWDEQKNDVNGPRPSRRSRARHFEGPCRQSSRVMP